MASRKRHQDFVEHINRMFGLIDKELAHAQLLILTRPRRTVDDDAVLRFVALASEKLELLRQSFIKEGARRTREER